MHREKIPLGFGLGVTWSRKNNNVKTVSVDYSVTNRHKVVVMVLCKCKQYNFSLTPLLGNRAQSWY